jgi:hypothetical protein
MFDLKKRPKKKVGGGGPPQEETQEVGLKAPDGVEELLREAEELLRKNSPRSGCGCGF